jgi:hypothetical protein
MILILCLLVMQVQVWASARHACQHWAGLTGAPVAGCCLHQAGREQGRHGHPASSFDCHKCVLHCAIGAHVLPASAPLLPDMGGRQASDAASEVHFYRFTPTSRYRPPISHLL